MIVWKGLGITIVICFGLLGLLFVEIFEWTENGMMIAMFPTAIFSFFVGSIVNAERDYDESHTLFFIPMQYWGPICLILGILGLILGWG